MRFDPINVCAANSIPLTRIRIINNPPAHPHVMASLKAGLVHRSVAISKIMGDNNKP
ncbi:MAG: hypothetical protein KQI35_03400 [Bacteroidetes bacterium]|nr:hypothetical protein [Bacteroidota bacterium]